MGRGVHDADDNEDNGEVEEEAIATPSKSPMTINMQKLSESLLISGHPTSSLIQGP
jgi:hypothetical protein